jgi:sec-independent protein translocase protein TatA
MGSLSIFHWIVVIGVVALFFGRGKISGLMGDVAQGITSFKKGLAEDETSPVDPAPSVDISPSSVSRRAETNGPTGSAIAPVTAQREQNSSSA